MTKQGRSLHNVFFFSSTIFFKIWSMCELLHILFPFPTFFTFFFQFISYLVISNSRLLKLLPLCVNVCFFWMAMKLILYDTSLIIVWNSFKEYDSIPKWAVTTVFFKWEPFVIYLIVSICVETYLDCW